MIPEDWRPIHRADGERVGYVSPDGVPRTLLGTALALHDGEDGRAALAERGLTALDRRWFARLPDELVPGVDPRRPDAAWGWHPVVVVEAGPATCRIRLWMASPAELRITLELPVPVGDLLLEEPPDV
ncbi:hypothetical protein [Amnibacterium sp.]|uniref:hypothetical protein n=1 Tax=Amnibacterium sp. TaxID=1872496 RepID=UPI002636356A|nr:hypothetical protein [Amnibacterium sp.]MCU1474855.1 hypothetical protein [Amnibacterium sp.]